MAGGVLSKSQTALSAPQSAEVSLLEKNVPVIRLLGGQGIWGRHSDARSNRSGTEAPVLRKQECS